MSARENVVHKAGTASLFEERRRFQRLHLQIPLFIRGKDANGQAFVELAKALDISALGALVTSPKPVNLGDYITLTIPAPSITSSALVPAGMPPIQGRVRRQHEAGDIFLVGIEFVKPIN
jgi:hypothetical protein